MSMQDNHASSSSNDREENIQIQLILVGFHHKKGHQIELNIGSLIDPADFTDEEQSKLCSLALPDGCHHREKDLIYFHYPWKKSSAVLFGVSIYRQVDAKTIDNRDQEITRNSIQKSLCLISNRIVFERVEDELRSILESYFQSRNLPNKSIVEDSFARLQLVASIAQPNRVEFYSIRDVYLRLRRKTLILLKLILLEKKIIFVVQPIELLVRTIYALISLVPGLVEHSRLGRPSTSTLDVSRRAEVLERRSSTSRSSLTTTISSIFKDSYRSASSSSSLSSNSKVDNCSSIEVDRSRFRYELFSERNVCLPYSSIYYLDLVRSRSVDSYVIGASNDLFRQDSNKFDVLVTNDPLTDDLTLKFSSNQVRDVVQLTRADLRFLQLFEDEQSNVRSEEELRKLFDIYLFSLLAVGFHGDETGTEDFNSSFVDELVRTESFHRWSKDDTQKSFRENIRPRHPQSGGQLNVNDVKLRFEHVLDESQAGRKIKDALQGTSNYLGEKSRSASQIIGQAKSSLFNSSWFRPTNDDRADEK